MRRLLPFAPVLLLAGCAGVQTPLAPMGDQASALHQLFILMMVVCGPIYLLVLAGIAWSLLRLRKQRSDLPSPAGRGGDAARHRPDADVGTPPSQPPPSRGEGQEGVVSDRSLDRGIWVAVAIIVAGLTVLIVGSFLADRALFSTRGEPAMEVRVTGHQWWWRIEYRDPASGRVVETANELHLPRGRTTRVLLGSADVIHSFWVPNVAGKLDMIPGRQNVLDLTPRRVGWFRGQCTEFCGLQHAHMAFDVKVDEPAAFDAWLAAQARPAQASSDPHVVRGRAVFSGACAACHVVRGTPANGRAGPDLTHLASRRSIAAGTLPMSRGGLQGWIAQPQALKPGTSMPAVPLSPQDAEAVSHYLAGLR